ncbi:MAG: hypothetical protein ABI806_08230 [Candidatus Solibacter sp.]
MHLESTTGETEAVRYLAESDGSWYLAAPCPNEKGVAIMRQKQAEARAQAERAFRLANQLKEPLRGELLYLVSKQRTAEAARKYQQATGMGDVTNGADGSPRNRSLTLPDPRTSRLQTFAALQLKVRWRNG